MPQVARFEREIRAAVGRAKPQDNDDLAQAVRIRVWRAIERHDGPPLFLENYVRLSIRNAIRGWFSDRARAFAAAEASRAEAAKVAETTARPMQETEALVGDLVGKLEASGVEGCVFVEIAYRGWTRADEARVRGVSLAQVGRWYAAGRERARRLLGVQEAA